MNSGQKLVAETQSQVEPKLKALEQTLSKKLTAAGAGPAAAPAGSAPAPKAAAASKAAASSAKK